MNNSVFDNAAKAQDLGNLLDHIAWTEILEPALQKHRKQCADLMVNKVLGKPIPMDLSLEQLAGRVEGIDFVMETISQVLRKGLVAEQTLRDIGINLE